MNSSQVKKSIFLIIILILSSSLSAYAIDIGNGKLFTCSDGTIFSVKNNTEVSAKKAIRKFKKAINKQTARIKNSSKGSKARKKATRAKKAAKRGLKDAKSCRDGTLNGTIVGSWRIVTEDGMTPAENGYTSLNLTFTSNGFTSVLVGPTSCNWQGTYESSNNGATLAVTTTVGTGGTVCEQAVDKTLEAAVTLADNGNSLTLDYRSDGGTLQVYERVS